MQSEDMSADDWCDPDCLDASIPTGNERVSFLLSFVRSKIFTLYISHESKKKGL